MFSMPSPLPLTQDHE
jgi:hypothetical protein